MWFHRPWLPVAASLLDISHGDQGGALDARDGKFLRFANVNQHQGFPRFYSALDVFRASFYWEDHFAHESEDSALENCSLTSGCS